MRAPDTIEPYVGYKYLRLSGGFRLYSNTGTAEWPHGKALEAVCHHDWGYEWEIVSRGEAQVPYKKGKRAENHFGGQSPTYKNQWWIGDMPLSYKPPKRPVVELPDQLAWSYNKKICPHDPVAEDCTCGIYVVASLEEAAGYYHYGRLLVKVALWGKVIIGDQGARGQYAYPLEIIGSNQNNDEETMEGVGIAYGIPFPGYAPPPPAPKDDLIHDREPQDQLGEPEYKSRPRIRTFLNL